MIKLDPSISKNLSNIESKLNQIQDCDTEEKASNMLQSIMQDFTMLVVVINKTYKKLLTFNKEFNKSLDS